MNPRNDRNRTRGAHANVSSGNPRAHRPAGGGGYQHSRQAAPRRNAQGSHASVAPQSASNNPRIRMSRINPVAAGSSNAFVPDKGGQFEWMKAKKKSKAPKRILIALAVVLVVLLTAFFAFSCSLDSSLSQNSDTAFDSEATDYGRPFYILLLGSDSREGNNTSTREDESGDNQRSDVMVLLRCDLAKKSFVMITVPRDTMWTSDDGQVHKINEAYNLGGASQSCKAVEKVTGVTVSHYVEIKISQLEALVDAIGGVEVTVDQDLVVNDTLTGQEIHLSAGTQTLDGVHAQAFARARHEYTTNQDAHRQNNVRTLIEAIAKKVTTGNPVEVPGKIVEAAKYVGTDIRSADLYNMGLRFVSNSASMTMQSCSGPSNGGMHSASNLWLCYENPQGWANLFAVLDEGRDPNSVDYTSTEIKHY